MEVTDDGDPRDHGRQVAELAVLVTVDVQDVDVLATEQADEVRHRPPRAGGVVVKIDHGPAGGRRRLRGQVAAVGEYGDEHLEPIAVVVVEVVEDDRLATADGEVGQEVQDADRAPRRGPRRSASPAPAGRWSPSRRDPLRRTDDALLVPDLEAEQRPDPDVLVLLAPLVAFEEALDR